MRVYQLPPEICSCCRKPKCPSQVGIDISVVSQSFGVFEAGDIIRSSLCLDCGERRKAELGDKTIGFQQANWMRVVFRPFVKYLKSRGATIKVEK